MTAKFSWRKKGLGRLPKFHRRLFYKYGRIAVEDRFPLAIQVFKEGKVTKDFIRSVEEDGVGVIIEVGQLLEKLGADSDQSRDRVRDHLWQAYYDYLMIRGRPPLQKELLRREWEISAIEFLAENRITLKGGKDLAEILNGYFARPTSRPAGMPELADRRNRRTLIREMGLTVLGGDRLPAYRRLYNELTSDDKTPDMNTFVNAAMRDPVLGKRLKAVTPLEDMPLLHLIELLAAPFDLNPYERWIQSYETNTKAFAEFFNGRLGLTNDEKESAMSLHHLVFRLGCELEIQIEGSQPTAGLFSSREGQKAIKNAFFLEIRRIGEIPNFCSFWLESPTARNCLNFPTSLSKSQRNLLEDFAAAYLEVAKFSSRPERTGLVAEKFPAVGFLASALEPVNQTREPMIYWNALHIDPSLQKIGGGSESILDTSSPLF